MKIPVILFVYNRPKHTKITIESLSSNYLATEVDLYIFSDAPKNNKDIIKVKKVRDYLARLELNNNFEHIEIEYAENNKGLANSVIYGVTKIINIYDYVIVLEDDLITSKDFLNYMTNAIEFYKTNDKVWSISGYCLPIRIPDKYDFNVFLSPRASSWGWATWKDRWLKVDWDVKDYDNFKFNICKRLNFNQGGRDMANMLDLQMMSKIDSWAIRWCYSQFKESMYTIYPVKSKVKNIGLDGSGTHSKLNHRFDVEVSEYDINLDTPPLNRTILRRFKKYFISYKQYLLLKPKRVIKGIYMKIKKENRK